MAITSRCSPLRRVGPGILAVAVLLAVLPPAFQGSWARALRVARGARRELEAEDFRELLERPQGAEDLQEILKEMLSDEDQLKESNETFQTLAAAQRGEAVDPLARFLSDPQQVWAWMQSSDKTERLAAMMNRSPLFEKLRKFGAEVLERRQMATLPPGALVEINGLKEALHLNGLVGELAEPTPAEQAENAERRIVDLEDAQGRVAVHPKNLVFPRHKPGDAVLLDAEFQPGTEHEGLEGRAAVVSTLTAEEQQLGFDENSGRLVVDVLSLLPGGPILERILMWPEHLQRRPFQPGDGVTLRALQSDEGLNGRPGIVQGPGSAVWKYLVILEDGRLLDVRWKNLLLTSAMTSVPQMG